MCISVQKYLISNGAESTWAGTTWNQNFLLFLWGTLKITHNFLLFLWSTIKITHNFQLFLWSTIKKSHIISNFFNGLHFMKLKEYTRSLFIWNMIENMEAGQIGPKPNRPKVKSAPSQIGPSQIGPKSNRPHFCCLLLSTCKDK